jgi:hypothetical protein
MKFWWHGVDIIVTAASALLVAGIVGLFWFLKKEFELWYEQKKAACEEARAIGKQLFGLKLQLLEVQNSTAAELLVLQVENLFLLHFEVNNPPGREFFEKWFSTKRIYQALRSENARNVVTDTWAEFVSDLAAIGPTPVYDPFPFVKGLRRQRRARLKSK